MGKTRELNGYFATVLPRYFIPILILFFLASGFRTAQSQPITITVTSTAGDASANSLGDAINQINLSPEGGVINLSGIAGGTINLAGPLSVLSQNVTILGSGVTINGQDLYTVFNLNSGAASIDSLTITDALAQGGRGGTGDSTYGAGGGGGAGLGGAVFVNSGVTLNVSNVSVESSQAIGGNGAGFGTNNLVGGGGGGGNGGDGQSDGTGGVGVLGTGGTGGNAFGQGEEGGDGGNGGGGGGGNGLLGNIPPHGGDGGFGGGGGGGGIGPYIGLGGEGGEYAGDGSWGFDGSGGGGAGLGGGIFVNSGGALIISQGFFSGNSAVGGDGPNLAEDGQGLGGDLFLYNSGVTFMGAESTLMVDSIDGTGNLVVAGPGVVLLAGDNGYSGGTSVTGGGTLNVVADNNLGDASSAVTLDNGSLRTSGDIDFGAGRDLVLGSGNGTFNTLGFYSSWNGDVTGSGGLVVIGGGALTLTNGANDYSGGTSIGGGAMVVVGNDSNLGEVNGAVILDNGALAASADVDFILNRSLVLGNGNGLFNTNGRDSSWNGLIEGGGSLAVTGGGSLLLTNISNSFSGGTSVGGAATLIVENDGSLGHPAGTVTLDNGTLQTSAGVYFNQDRGMVLGAGNGTFDTQGQASCWGGVISGAGGLSLVGGGALTLANNNSYTGQTDISAGRLVLGVSDALTATGALNVEAGGILDLGSLTQSIGSLEGAGGVSMGDGSLTVGANDLGSLFSGEISSTGGAGGLTKVGSGALTLSGANGYSGGTSVAGGALGVYGDSNLGTGGLALYNGGALQTLNNGMHLTKDVTLSSGGGTIDTVGMSSYLDGVISGTGGLAVTGAGLVAVTSNANSYNGGTSVGAGTTLSVGNDGNLGAAAGAVTLNNAVLATSAEVNFNSSRGLVLSGSGTIDLNGFNSSWQGQITGSGMLSLTSSSGGPTLTLSGNNSYTGGTSITGVFAAVGADASLGDADGNLYLSNNGGLKITSDVTFDAGRQMWLTDAGQLDLNGQNAAWQGQILGAGGLYVASSTGGGTLALRSFNDYNGGTTIAGNAVLDVDGDNRLGYDTGRVTFDNGTLRTSAEVIFNVNRDMTLNAGRTGTLDTQGYHSYWQGLIDGGGALNVTGGGILSLISSSNTYSGGTSVGGGSTLDISGDGSLGAGAGAVTLDNGTLQTSTGMDFNANRNLVLGSGNGTFNTRGYGLCWNGVISGAGGLSITGGGALILAGNNTYTGLTDVSGAWLVLGLSNALGATNDLILEEGGVLDLGGFSQSFGSLEGSGGVTLNGGSLTLGTDDSSALFSGAISGGGSVTKTGAGTFTLAGIGEYSGGTVVEEGALMVGDAASTGTVLNGPVTVSNNARLGGYGTINGAVTNSGTIQPGGTGGVLAIAQLDEGPDSLLVIDVLPANYQSGRLSVGSADLDGGVTVVLNGGGYGIRYRYIILSSATSILTSFDSVCASATFMTPTLTYGWDAVTLTLLRDGVDFETLFARTPNQTVLAGVLNESIPAGSDEFIDKLNGLYLLSPDEGRFAMDQMSGSFYLPLAGIMLNNHLFANRMLFAHADGSGFAMPSAVQSLISQAVASEISQDAPGVSRGLQAAAKSPRLWVESIIGSGKTDGNDNVIGYETKKMGFVAAYDTPLSGEFKAGLSAAYHRLFLDTSDSGGCETRVDNALLGIYGGPSFGDWDITAAVQYGLDKYQTHRAVSIGPELNLAQADFDGSEISASLQISSKLLNDPAFNLKTLFGAQYTHLSMNGFTETGAGALNLTLAGQAYDSMRPFAGLDGAGTVNLGGNTVLTPMANLSLYRELMELNPQIQAGLAGASGMGYTVSGMTPTSLILGVGAGAKLVTGRGFNLYAAFNGHFGGNQTSNSLHGGASFNF